ncbi:hypothetical protein MKEN_00340100 [Mycena kentingensis (nom. inval.)]|nr:hypothetical protein MKEN_00340100 [Mycena kentingensis (nom. inval.)]
MPVGYSPLAAQDVDELEAAFDGDDTTDHPSQTHVQPAHVPGAYDFERDYDHPPPGSPPRGTFAVLGNTIGNSNGVLPGEAAIPQPPRPSIFRRAVGAILPTHYAQLPTSEPARGVHGGGQDGVWANVSARPTAPVRIPNEEGIMVPEETQKLAPPSYADAQQDAVPQYYETNTVHIQGPISLDSEILIDDLQSGNIGMFLFNLTISAAFQFPGFLLTYLLHTSHAGKYGSRAGLGLTLIQYGFASRSGAGGSTGFGPDGSDPDEVPDFGLTPNAEPSPIPSEQAPSPDSDISDFAVAGISSRDWLSFLLMTLGCAGSAESGTSAEPITPEERERDLLVRRNIENIFGLAFDAEEETHEQRRRQQRRQPVPVQHDANGRAVVIPTQELLEEARLARDLRAAGLL